MYQISFYVPESHVEQVKLALFNAGAGQIGDYKHCSWQVLGEGQFLPDSGANPFIGEKDQLTKVSEFYVQMICTAEKIKSAISALKASHPYEEPAYYVIKLELT